MSAGPVETVTIVITDLVGSTQLEARVGPIVAEELRAEHFALLREGVGEAGGREVKNTGDGLMLAFASAAAAVSCAVSIQQRFERRNRSAAEPLLIKAGVSSGDASTAEGDVFGMPVIEAARLCDRCSAGQILAKEIVTHLAAGRGHAFRSVGALELKGLPEPMSAVDVQWEPLSTRGIALPERLRELPSTGYVGRLAERERLTTLWQQASTGQLRIGLISGEAGVGKTRLATHLAHEAHAEGANVLYGRCDEDLGVPYQPWVQALGHLIREIPQAALDGYVEKHGTDLAPMVPALRDRVGNPPAAREGDPETARYLLYAAATGLLASAAADGPLLLILDDLQWADGPTLSLLRHVAAEARSVRLMVVGTYRDSDLSRDHPLTALLADLHREQGIERLKLVGLAEQDVRAMMEAAAGHALDEAGRALAAEITRETAGNPFFAGEMLRHLTETGAIEQQDGGRWRLTGPLAELGLPQSVREVVGRRIERLGPDARTMLSAAAVIGRDFELELLLKVVQLPEERVLDLLAEGVEASLLTEGVGHAGCFTFTHALVVHTLYEDLGAARRARLHRQVAEALEQQCGADPGQRLGELAGHWAAAVVSADIAKAKEYARRAAERALAQLAPSEAVRWYRQALEFQVQSPGGDRAERCELMIGLGQALRQSGDPEFRQTLLDAAAMAQELGAVDLLCLAALVNSRGWESQVGAVDSERVKVQEAAAAALPDTDPRRGRVLALLAAELHWAHEPDRCRRLASEAIGIARASGNPAVLADTLINASWAIWVPDTLQVRLGLVDELVELSQRLEDPWLSFWVAARNIMVGEEAADRPRVESSLTTMRALAAEVPQPAIAFARHLIEFCWALVEGDLEAGEQWAIQGFEVGTASGQPDAALMVGAQLFQVRYFQGRLDELVDQIAELAAQEDSLPAWRSGAALALVEAGRREEALELALAEDLRSAAWDQAWCLAMYWWSDACSRLGLIEHAEVLYELLLPFSGQLAASGAVVMGSVDWALGTLALTRKRHEQAADHFAAAATIEGRLGAPLLLARTRVGWARALIARGRGDDNAAARDMLEKAEGTAEHLQAGLIAQELTACRTVLASTAR